MRRADCSDAALVEQVRRRLSDDDSEAAVDFGDLVGELLDSTGDPTQDVGDRAWSKLACLFGEPVFGQVCQLAAKRIGRRYDQRAG